MSVAKCAAVYIVESSLTECVDPAVTLSQRLLLADDNTVSAYIDLGMFVKDAAGCLFRDLLACYGVGEYVYSHIEPAEIRIVGGDNQTGTVSTLLRDAIDVQVLNASGDGLWHISVTFAVASGGGLVERGTSASVTKATIYGGTTSTDWTLGPAAGTQTLLVSAQNPWMPWSHIERTVTATALAPNADIVFHSSRDGNDELYTMSADGSNQHRLTTDPGSDFEPAWSPDHRKIAWASNRSRNFDIYVMNADGTNVVQLTNAIADDRWPRWSPDGSKLTFYSWRDGNAQIHVMNADGSNQTRIGNNGSLEYDPSFSPDGKQIVFVSDRSGNQDIWVMNADGTSPHQLTTNGAIDYAPAWSPDGSQIAFTSLRDGTQEVYVMNADGSNQTRVTVGPSVDYYPSWASDGTRLTFASNRSGRYQVYAINTDGTGMTALTDAAGDNYGAFWRH